LSVARQCALLDVPRSSYYYRPQPVRAEELVVMRAIDEIYTSSPFYGSRRVQVELQRRDLPVNRKRIQRLMRLMGLEAVGPKPRLSQAAPAHRVYPYLLRDIPIERVDQVWSTDITYIRLRSGFVYLVAILDWFSRYVLAWELSVTVDGQFCLDTLDRALASGCPTIFNTDQGAQFTSAAFTGRLQAAGVQISMDGRGRALDNVFVERLWRSVKWEEVYLKDYTSVPDARAQLDRYFTFYNHVRPHQSLAYRTPAAVYAEAQAA
jgi:putative transposase|tara:strand:- start:174 stop:965 length:792 start_codon:yes stop_codon:yes gene_type:complete